MQSVVDETVLQMVRPNETKTQIFDAKLSFLLFFYCIDLVKKIKKKFCCYQPLHTKHIMNIVKILKN